MLDNKLIENALALTGKTMEEFQEYHMSGPIWSIERFCYYLLSPSFIEKYCIIAYKWTDLAYINKSRKEFGLAIGKYQSGNEKPLIELLSKITRQS